jgi:hypothetical protein
MLGMLRELYRRGRAARGNEAKFMVEFVPRIADAFKAGRTISKRQNEILEKKLRAYGLLPPLTDVPEDDTLRRLRALWQKVMQAGNTALADRVKDWGERYKQLGNFTQAQEDTVEDLFQKYRVGSGLAEDLRDAWEL